MRDFLSGRKQAVVVNGNRSEEADVCSGVPQGSVLGPTLFVMYINDLPQQVKTNVRMFADDTKLFARTDTREGTECLQEDLNRLQDWSDKWLLKFHPEKCSVIKLGRQKSEGKYFMNKGQEQQLELRESGVERDLGVMVDSGLVFKEHVAYCTAKANKVVGIIRRSFDHLTEHTFVQLYKSLVRPLLEYGHCVWQPHHKTLCSYIEDGQRREKKLLGSLRDKPYSERLRSLKLPCLEHRRLRGDMIEVHKYLHGYYSVQHPTFIKATTTRLRGHSMKLYKSKYRLNVRGNFLSHRIVDSWNDLPDSVVSATSVNSFKNLIDHHWRDLPSLYEPECQK